MDIKLTIIMSNYNQESYIRQSLDSILMQNVNFKFRIIITDDNSKKDNSVSIIKEYAKKYPDIIYPLYNKENGGYLRNILRAKEITKTPYFCLLDADDYYIDTFFLQRAYDFLEQNKEYVIYYENVKKLYTDGKEEFFIDKKKHCGSYELGNLIDGTIPIVQTTGQFYRNVIFKDGIPKIMSEAVGTVAERSFEGDFDRFVMHLKYGKAFYNNRVCGIYRVFPNSGIWAKLPEYKKHLITMQSYFDYNRYYEDKHKSFFITKMYQELNYFTDTLRKSILGLEKCSLSNEDMKQFLNLFEFIKDNESLIEKQKKKLWDYTLKEILKKMLMR